MITLYGIPNCDSMRKARALLESARVPYVFHNYKTQGLDEATLRGWLLNLGADRLINTRGTTWRKLQPTVDNTTGEAALQLILANLSLIKRPLLVSGNRVILGNEALEAALVDGSLLQDKA